MIEQITTIEQARAHRYGSWAGRPTGFAYQEGFCAESVPVGGRSPLFKQCSRGNGHGPNGLYCRQHAKRFEPA